uniref:Uncharacterized protein n=1 Tax=Hanusia phi TaxID=3032 RepID=A0A7S0I1W9_9CRYP|mmetsp:Transcript_8143/g.18588  ORF Transcript_8143/g.18588 Transcript_8143/m.18588 type:complete len:243 (+) Transcript_8143:253-981(+)|eukprot:768184-Hanusia_phi.AAC.1
MHDKQWNEIVSTSTSSTYTGLLPLCHSEKKDMSKTVFSSTMDMRQQNILASSFSHSKLSASLRRKRRNELSKDGTNLKASPRLIVCGESQNNKTTLPQCNDNFKAILSPPLKALTFKTEKKADLVSQQKSHFENVECGKDPSPASCQLTTDGKLLIQVHRNHQRQFSFLHPGDMKIAKDRENSCSLRVGSKITNKISTWKFCCQQDRNEWMRTLRSRGASYDTDGRFVEWNSKLEDVLLFTD